MLISDEKLNRWTSGGHGRRQKNCFPSSRGSRWVSKYQSNNCGKAILDVGKGHTQVGRKKSEWGSCQKVQQGLQTLVCGAKASFPVWTPSFETLPSHLVHIVESNFKKHYEKIRIWRINVSVLGKKRMAQRIPFELCSSPASLYTPGRSFLEPRRANSDWVRKKAPRPPEKISSSKTWSKPFKSRANP